MINVIGQTVSEWREDRNKIKVGLQILALSSAQQFQLNYNYPLYFILGLK